MKKCPICGRDKAYVGLNIVECRNKKCVNFKTPPRTGITAKVHWEVNGRKGCSRVLDLADAVLRAEDGDEEYGLGTHWVEKEPTPIVDDDEGLEWLYGLGLP